ncbi:putative selection and upkeep of intraepithelial T-cells protein 1 homolog [Fundulus heteroclitus]|uniref:putative selection and upkeep of intraepithelial T-cells protein 1 homolog n=1 Tax=Fundulus heteroclitus TaxID=8078 RepID=UPI00165ABA72|nr:putative selection and upkeep of intraepithelial T-cells protein 1 homolog [Fundulus heteroclitus]
MYFCLCFISFFGVLLSKAHAQPEKIEAFAGGHAILPCSWKNPASDHVPTVEWSKEGLNDSIVFLYRDGCETFGMKNVDFEFRASLFMKEVKNGNVSLRISNLRLSDAGTYQCLIIQSDKTRQTTRVELVVAAVSDLKLAVVFEEKEVVAVTCDASCRLPPPIIIIQDDEGNDVTDKEPSQQQDARGCYATRQNFSMQDSKRRVVCRVKQPQTDMNRTVEILLPDFQVSK